MPTVVKGIKDLRILGFKWENSSQELGAREKSEWWSIGEREYW